MATDITCPNCRHQFSIEDAVTEEYKKELRAEMIAYKKKTEDELNRREREFQSLQQQQEQVFTRRMQEEKMKLQQSLEENLRKTITADYQNQVELLKRESQDTAEKLKLARQKELKYLRKEQELQTKEAELELTTAKRLQEERAKLSDEIRKFEEQKNAQREAEYSLRLKELEKQLDDQKKLAEEMRRKAEQGSMQLQGEVQELALEEMLRQAFPFDLIGEVGKGVRGADCIQTVRNNIGQECGKIIYESKRTNAFSADWIEKLRADMRSQGADVAVIVTRVMPKDLDQFGEKNGVWICSFAEVRALAHVLRDGILRIHTVSKKQENKGDKMHMLYDYLTSNEFAEGWKAIREGFMGMKISIQKERDAMEKLWKAREKQLEKVLLNAAHIRGSIEGIAGSDSINLALLDEPSDDLLE
jgi:hypothetical protein